MKCATSYVTLIVLLALSCVQTKDEQESEYCKWFVHDLHSYPLNESGSTLDNLKSLNGSCSWSCSLSKGSSECKATLVNQQKSASLSFEFLFTCQSDSKNEIPTNITFTSVYPQQTCRCKVLKEEKRITCEPFCPFNVGLETYPNFPACKEEPHINGFSVYFSNVFLIVCIFLIFIEDLKYPNKVMPCITLGFIELLNITYGIYQIFYVQREISLVKDSAVSTIFFYGTVLLFVAATLKIVCISFSATKRLFEFHSGAGVVELAGILYLIVSVMSQDGSHLAIDMANAILFLPIILCNLFFEHVCYSHAKILCVSLEVFACNILHSALPGKIMNVDGQKCIVATIVLFCVIPLQGVILIFQRRGCLRNLCGNKSVPVPTATYETNVEKDKPEDCCCICLGRDQGKVYTKTPCSHYIHTECLKEWLGRQSFCPICRTPIPALNVV